MPVTEEKEENRRQEKDKDCVTHYFPPGPIYMASYEEDTPTLVNNLVPEPTPKEKKDTDKKEENKTTEDRGDLIEIVLFLKQNF